MVLRETQRAFVYFNLHGLTVDDIIVNRLFPEGLQDPFFANWHESQRHVVSEIQQYFAPVHVRQVPMFSSEVVGYERLREMAQSLYRPDEDPSLGSRVSPPYSFTRVDDHYEVRLDFPFAEKAEVGLFKKHDELVIQLGTLRRHVGLPTVMARLVPVKAHLKERILVVEMREPE